MKNRGLTRRKKRLCAGDKGAARTAREKLETEKIPPSDTRGYDFGVVREARGTISTFGKRAAEGVAVLDTDAAPGYREPLG